MTSPVRPTATTTCLFCCRVCSTASLKTEQNLQVVKQVPLDRLQLETNGPWCEIRPSHASMAVLKGDPDAQGDLERFEKVKKEKWVEGAMVKGRNEPS